MHAYVATRLGDPTPRRNGRLTLNPMVHVDFVGLLMLLLMGFGWAKPVMINPSNFANRRKGRVLVSIAGPLTNLALAFVFFAIFHFSGSALAQSPVLVNILYQFVYINILLFAFNMIPIPPLDGFSLLELFIHPSRYQSLNRVRQYGFMLLIVLALFGVLGMYVGFVNNVLIVVFNFIFSLIDKLVALI